MGDVGAEGPPGPPGVPVSKYTCNLCQLELPMDVRNSMSGKYDIFGNTGFTIRS